jgi:hypothetical protein
VAGLGFSLLLTKALVNWHALVAYQLWLVQDDDTQAAAGGGGGGGHVWGTDRAQWVVLLDAYLLQGPGRWAADTALTNAN